MSNENSDVETDNEPTGQEASSTHSTERESLDEVPEYEGQWAALSDGESVESDCDSDRSSGQDTDGSSDQ